MIEKTSFGCERICGYGCRESMFLTHFAAKTFYKFIKSARGDTSQFKIGKIEGEVKFPIIKKEGK